MRIRRIEGQVFWRMAWLERGQGQWIGTQNRQICLQLLGMLENVAGWSIPTSIPGIQ